ncbi:tol-pal system protein YbgF [Desulfobaculum sp.]
MKRLLTLSLLGMTTLSMTACVNPDDIKTLDNRVYDQKVRIDTIETKVNDLSKTDPQQADIWSQVQSMRREMGELQDEVATLRRQLDEQNTAIAANTNATKALTGDVRDVQTGWHSLTTQLGADVDLDTIRKERLAREQAAQPAPAPLPGMDANATATQPASGESPEPGAPAADANATASAAGDAAAQPADTAAKATDTDAAIAKQAPALDAATTLYDSARAAFEKRDYTEAQARWEEFATNFPDHKLVSNAIFWQGECYYQLKDYARAVLKYQEVLDKYKKSYKYPTSLLKQGLSFMRLGRVKAGRLLLHDVIDKFPKSAEARRAKAILKGL